MIYISQNFRQEISKDMIDLSEKLFEQFHSLEEREHAEKIKEIETRIGAAATAYRMATDIGNAQEIRKAASELEKVKKERWSLKFQREQAIKELRNPIEQLNFPLIEQVCFLIDQEIDCLPKQRILMVTDTMMTLDPLNQGVVRVVQTNRRGIGEVRALLMDGKSKVKGMRHSSISEILSFIEGLEEKINKVDLKKCESVRMRDNEFHDEESLRDGGKPQTFSPEYHEMAQFGYWHHKIEDTLFKVGKTFERIKNLK